MKFSERKKKKMKKIRQRRIKKMYGHVIGMKIPYYSCSNNPDITWEYVRIIDQTYINDELYFLVSYQDKDVCKVFIYKVVDVSQYSCLSAKKLIKYKRHFESPGQWQENTTIHIKDGVLSVEWKQTKKSALLADAGFFSCFNI